MGRVADIFICADKGQPMIRVGHVQARAGKGLEGDRYAEGRGAYSHGKREVIRHVSLISIEAIQEANTQLRTSFSPAETRRNILTEGVDLNNLVGQHFYIGEVRMLGVELCDPCARPSKLSGKPDFATAFESRGGLRAAVLNDGLIQVSMEIKTS